MVALACGCARGPNVSSEQLPLRKVVVYRNGVGYFERSGKVDSERVTFNMKSSMVGDFLATLAIVERGGSSVRAASFPLEVDDEEASEEPPPEPLSKHAPPPRKPKQPKDPLREVQLELDGDEHDLLVGYVSKTPLWRPSYRVVVQSDGKALLQTWGVVQNLSGEDWEDVELSLVAGAPLAFESTLGTPVIPQRPVVTDQGEVIFDVPTSTTSLQEAPAPEPSSAPMEEAEVAADADMALDSMGSGVRMSKAARGEMAPAAPPAPMATKPQSLSMGALGSNARVSALANVAVQGSNTVYALPARVTVPNNSATMVLLVNQSVPGESVFLFAPDYGVPDSFAHPFRVARFANTTTGLLEKGPIAVFESGAFLGEGILEPLPPGAKATVPFALDRSLAVQSENRFDQRGARLYRIEAGRLYIERDQIQETIYQIKNGTDKPARVLLKHPRAPETKLDDPPTGTEDNVGTGFALIPAVSPAKGQSKITVTESRAQTEQTDWLGPLAEIAVKAYLQSPTRDGKVAQRLGEVWDIRSKLRGFEDENDKLAKQARELENAMDETRRNLRAIEKNTQAGDLRAKLTKRLNDQSAQHDGIEKRLVELGLMISEQQVRLRDALQDLSLPPQQSK